MNNASRFHFASKYVLLCIIAIGAIIVPGRAAVLTYQTNLNLWLKADSIAQADNTPVAAWNDSSTTANNASQGTVADQPTYHTSLFSGAPGLTFDGTDSMNLLLYGNHALNATPLTYFAVFRTTSTTAGSVFFPGRALVSDSSGGIGMAFGVDSGVGSFSEYNGAGGTNWTKLNANTSISDGTPHILSLVNETSATNTNGTTTFYRDSAADGSGTTAYGAFRSYNTIGFGAGSLPFLGDIAEILIYHQTLDSVQRGQVESYLSEKYAIPLPEPTAGVMIGIGMLSLFRRRATRSKTL
jgi:hypothetical protein